MLNQRLKEDLIDALMKLPGIQSPDARSTLLSGIRVPLGRSNNFFVDLDTIVNQLDGVGRLDNGERPVVIVAHNAGRFVHGTELGQTLGRLEREIEKAYGEEEPASDVPTTPEALVFGGPGEWVTSTFLEQAMLTGTRVARLRVPRIVRGQEEHPVGSLGTGWLIGPCLLLTNHHVVNARERGEPAALKSDFTTQGRSAVAWFDYFVEGRSSTEIAAVDLVHSNAALDYALLRLADHKALQTRKQIALPQNAPQLDRGTRLNVAQYPGGGPLRLAIRNNFFVGRGEKQFQIRYLTDTIEGSSGSPVLDDNWQVIALHHGARKVNPQLYDKEPGVRGIVKFHNQGIDIQAIIADLPAEAAREIRAAQGWS
jgi:endonuclease G